MKNNRIDKSFSNIYDPIYGLIKLLILLPIALCYIPIYLNSSFHPRIGPAAKYSFIVILGEQVITSIIRVIAGLIYRIIFLSKRKTTKYTGLIERILFDKNKFIFKIKRDDGEEFWTHYYLYSLKFKKKMLYNENYINRQVSFYLSNKNKAIIEEILIEK